MILGEIRNAMMKFKNKNYEYHFCSQAHNAIRDDYNLGSQRAFHIVDVYAWHCSEIVTILP